jgi:hypothetical protein
MNVPTSPAIRMNILTARFMGSSPIRVEYSRKETFSRSRIIGHVSSQVCKIFHPADLNGLALSFPS